MNRDNQSRIRILCCYSQVQPYEEENQQLGENLQANQAQLENLQADTNSL